MNAFLTGSRAYGKPRNNSDYDLVVLVDEDTLDALKKASVRCIACEGTGKQSKTDQLGNLMDCIICNGMGWFEYTIDPQSDRDGEMSQGSFRFGALNIIALTDECMFDVWRKATDFLVRRRPVSTEKATEYMRKKRDRYLESKKK